VEVSGNNLVLSVEGAKCTPLKSNRGSGKDTISAGRHEWRPDVDFVPVESLVRAQPTNREDFEALEKLTVLTVLEIHQSPGLLTTCCSWPSGKIRLLA
jgi:hypothetical protein